MARPGENSGQTYADKTKQKNIVVEEHRQPQHEMMAPQHDIAEQRQVERAPSAYDRFFQTLKPLPPVPVTNGPAPQEEKVGYKERKRRKEQYKYLGDKQRLLSEEEVKGLKLFKTQKAREEWANETLPHSKLTREQTLKQILNDKDYSNFENLDHVMRNLIANKALSQFMDDYGITAEKIENKEIDPQALCERLQQNGAGVSVLLNPALRLGLSLAQRTRGFSTRQYLFFEKLDEAMSTAVMVSTLTHVAERDKVKTYFEGKGSANADSDADSAIKANMAQQIQIAKRLLLMQLSDFKVVHTEKTGTSRTENWSSSMAVALSHCSRVTLTLPKQDQRSPANEQEKMWRSILTTGGENTAQDNSRGSSTHSLERRKIKDGGKVKEKKVLFNLIGQRGMNCAIGGLGNAGVSGKTLCNDGSCGHFYSMYKEADADHYGAMLMGLESDAYGVTNQMGHTHDIHATGEKASSLGGQRMDEVGDKYGGRQCNLASRSAGEITDWMEKLECAMLYWQSQEGGMSSPDAVLAMKMISGEKMRLDDQMRLYGILKEAQRADQEAKENAKSPFPGAFVIDA